MSTDTKSIGFRNPMAQYLIWAMEGRGWWMDPVDLPSR